MRNATVSISQQSLAPATRVTPSTAARTKLLLEGPILTTLLRLAAPNILNLLAFAGVITFDGFFLGRIGTNALAGASLAVAAGFCLYAAILVYAVSSVSVDRRESSGRPQAASSKRRVHPFARSI
jgi:hypothetical protein